MLFKYFIMKKHLLLVFLLTFALTGCIEQVDENQNLVTPTPSPIIVSENLVIEDIIVGEGTEAVQGSTVTVHYTGLLEDGIIFDSSLDRGEPFTFNIGAGQVIEGWEQGLIGMRVGGQRTLTIPPELGYGDNALANIPAGSTLIFNIELLEVE